MTRKIVRSYDSTVRGTTYHIEVMVYDDGTYTAEWRATGTSGQKYALGYGIEASGIELEAEVEKVLRGSTAAWSRA